MVRQNTRKRKLPQDIFLILTVLFVGLGFFALGRISVVEREEGEVVFIEAEDRVFNDTFKPLPEPAVAGVSTDETFSFVASQNGERYYPTTCPAANRISDENKRYFSTAEEAEREGYTEAKNCEGYW